MKNRKISRRQFVVTVTAGAGTLFLANKIAASGLNLTTGSFDPFQIVTLGKSGLKTTLLGLGTGSNGYNHSSAITRAGNAEVVIRSAYDKGIRFFDCADAYGTHPYTARALKGIPREKYTLGTKIMTVRPGQESPGTDADAVVDRFRKELDTDYLDLVQLHLMTSSKWTDEQKKQMDILETLKSKGIIRAHGVSVHSLEAMEAAAASSWVDVVHVRINPFGASMDSRDPGAVVPVIEKLHKAGKGVIGMKLIGNGSYSNDSSKIDHAIKFVLNLGTVDMVIVGFEKPEQIDNYVERIRKVAKA